MVVDWFETEGEGERDKGKERRRDGEGEGEKRREGEVLEASPVSFQKKDPLFHFDIGDPIPIYFLLILK